jgi:hypothetical protein
VLDRGDGGADAGDLGLGLEAAADDAERGRARSREIFRSDAAGGARAELSQRVRLEDACELGLA